MIKVNRKIIDIFITMLQNKGSEVGLKIATALCLTALDISKSSLELADIDTDYISALKDLKITYDYKEAKIYIDYPTIYTQVRQLLDYVRPVGMYIEARAILPFEHSNELVILAQAQHRISEYQVDYRSMVNKSEVNFSSPLDNIQFENIINLQETIIDMNEGV